MKNQFNMEYSDNKFEVLGSHVDPVSGGDFFLDEFARGRGPLLPINNSVSAPTGSSFLRNGKNIKHPNRSVRMKSIFALVLAFLFVLLTISSGISAEFSTETRDRLLHEYLPAKLVARMKADAEPFIKKPGGSDIFSCCQYGDRFLVGTVDTGDIFDARIPENMKIFKDYARDNLLIRNVGDEDEYNKYAVAALRFMTDLGYDVVLFHPDEFNLVFTNPDDTWMFVREVPVEKTENGKHFLSVRMKNRCFAIEGGLPMAPKKTTGFSIYYIPDAEAAYVPFRAGAGKIAEEFWKNKVYKPVTGTEEMLKKRIEMGIIPSPLSGRKAVKVGRWTGSDEAELEYKYGPRFKASGREYTWGDEGFYVVPLDADFLK